MQNPQIKFTYRDYLLLPEQDKRELIGGDFYYIPPSPNFGHQNIVMSLSFILAQDVVFSDFDVVQPDILFFHRA